jgi:hypothetical protein
MRVAFIFLTITFLLIFAGQSGAKIDNATIVAMWLFDDGSGKVVKDSSGNKNDGTITGDYAWGDGKFGKALEFNGKNTIVDCGNGASLDFNGKKNFSISAWVKSNNAKMASGVIVWKALGCSTWAQYGFGVGDVEGIGGQANKLSLYYRKTNGDAKELATDKNDIPANEWVHVAGTYDGSLLSLYKNGELVATQKSDGVPWASTEKVYIGGDPGCSIRYIWSGLIDELLIFKTTISIDDVKSLMKGYVNMSTTAVSSADKLATTWADVKSR